MKVKNFKVFMDRLKKADENDRIWYDMYLWFDLTYAQVEAVGKVLLDKPFCRRDGNKIYTPSGAEIYYPDISTK